MTRTSGLSSTLGRRVWGTGRLLLSFARCDPSGVGRHNVGRVRCGVRVRVWVGTERVRCGLRMWGRSRWAEKLHDRSLPPRIHNKDAIRSTIIHCYALPLHSWQHCGWSIIIVSTYRDSLVLGLNTSCSVESSNTMNSPSLKYRVSPPTVRGAPVAGMRRPSAATRRQNAPRCGSTLPPGISWYICTCKPGGSILW